MNRNTKKKMMMKTQRKITKKNPNMNKKLPKNSKKKLQI